MQPDPHNPDPLTQDQEPCRAAPHQTPSQAPRRTSRALLGLNAALLAVLAMVTLSPDAGAQSGPNRARGNYGVVGGDISFGNSDAFYVLDSANQELLALRWEVRGTGGEIKVIGRRDLRADASARVGR